MACIKGGTWRPFHAAATSDERVTRHLLCALMGNGKITECSIWIIATLAMQEVGRLVVRPNSRRRLIMVPVGKYNVFYESMRWVCSSYIVVGLLGAFKWIWSVFVWLDNRVTISENWLHMLLKWIMCSWFESACGYPKGVRFKRAKTGKICSFFILFIFMGNTSWWKLLYKNLQSLLIL